jgi:hypothetical protein
MQSEFWFYFLVPLRLAAVRPGAVALQNALAEQCTTACNRGSYFLPLSLPTATRQVSCMLVPRMSVYNLLCIVHLLCVKSLLTFVHLPVYPLSASARAGTV